MPYSFEFQFIYIKFMNMVVSTYMAANYINNGNDIMMFFANKII